MLLVHAAFLGKKKIRLLSLVFIWEPVRFCCESCGTTCHWVPIEGLIAAWCWKQLSLFKVLPGSALAHGSFCVFLRENCLLVETPPPVLWGERLLSAGGLYVNGALFLRVKRGSQQPCAQWCGCGRVSRCKQKLAEVLSQHLLILSVAFTACTAELQLCAARTLLVIEPVIWIRNEGLTFQGSCHPVCHSMTLTSLNCSADFKTQLHSGEKKKRHKKAKRIGDSLGSFSPWALHSSVDKAVQVVPALTHFSSAVHGMGSAGDFCLCQVANEMVKSCNCWTWHGSLE